MTNSFIYGLVDPETQELRYVGQTMIGMRRFRNGYRAYAAYCRNWLKNLKSRGLTPEVVILEETADLNQAERNWIAFGRALGCRLTNMTDGGEGTRLCGADNGFYGKKHDDETRKRMSEAKLGKKNPAHSARMTGRSGVRKGLRNKPASIEKLKQNHTGRKRVRCVNDGLVFESGVAVSAHYGVDVTSVSKVCLGKLKQCKGFRFEFI